MDYLTSSTKALYRKYLIASLGSALVITIYSFVDTIAVGQSEGPAGTAAMAVITPIFGILVFFGILFGIGGSVLMNNAKGAGNEEKGNAYFTTALILVVGFTVVTWVLFARFSKPILFFFGATQGTLPLVMRYVQWLLRCWPIFIFSTFIGAFVRNDNAPELVMAGVISGGCFNIFGDWFFVFPLGMGMEGAAIATVLGTTLQCLILCSHLFRKCCGLKLAKPFRMGKAIRKIFVIGIGASLLDLGTVVLSTITNNQILRYGSEVELAIYGVMTTIAALVQAMYCGVGQAILHQREMLRRARIDTADHWCQRAGAVHINTVLPDSVLAALAVFEDVCGDRAHHGCPVHSPCGMSACAHCAVVHGRDAGGFGRRPQQHAPVLPALSVFGVHGAVHLLSPVSHAGSRLHGHWHPAQSGRQRASALPPAPLLGHQWGVAGAAYLRVHRLGGRRVVKQKKG